MAFPGIETRVIFFVTKYKMTTPCGVFAKCTQVINREVRLMISFMCVFASVLVKEITAHQEHVDSVQKQ